MTLSPAVDAWAEEEPGAATDRSGWPGGIPSRVVRPRAVIEVQQLLAEAYRTRTPVIPRGAGSGLAAGAVGVEGAILLDLSALDRILELDADEQLARVEPGVITADLDAAASAHGLMYAPDPGSVGISTIGGNIATNAGGLRGAKYGVTRDHVLALDVVLADGSLVRVGRDTIKGVTGYDLVSLFTGSEGTLGVVVGATVRLIPRPARTATAAAYFADIATAARAVTAITRSGVRPAVLEILDGRTLAAIDDLEGTALRERGDALVVIQTDGYGAEEELEVLTSAIAALATDVQTATDAAASDALLFARRRALPALEALGRVLIEDIAVPRKRLAEAVDGISDIAQEEGVDIFVFGHAGDGNLHPIIVTERGAADDPVPDAAASAAERIFALALELGGTITAEHGVGRLKKEWALRELGPEVHALQWRLKEAFDSRGILNPGSSL
ncbi:FAD-linked oxidase C-terminal domain-containing protein [Microbacterium sp. BK668]|uniref:FAD-binding oxidoreductase n=1 Tax=Microbacterium sp. BK668 TaxID=2512118 RepID=UPI00105ED280|nr:FAD-linked oxidase C-terminal domain-containing protein [Microbacterium sp. BK668]TDN91907.1 glycolate oxidase [Microbacterium sp. BK668]